MKPDFRGLAAVWVAFAAFAAPAVASSPALLSVEAPAFVQPGATMDVVVAVSNVNDLAGFEIDVAFNPAAFELLSVTRGSFLGDPDNAAETMWLEPDMGLANASGLVENATCVRMDGVGVSGTGTLFTLSMRERAGGAGYATAIGFAATNCVLANSSPARIPCEVQGAVVLVLGDSDADGLPDWWENGWLRTLAYGPGDDPDGDGESMAEERANGTDPGNARSVNDPANRYDNFRFEIFRNGLQTPTGLVEEAWSWGCMLVCGAPDGETFLSGRIECPASGGGVRAENLNISPDAGQAWFVRSDLETETALQADFGSGTYRVALETLDSGSVTQRLTFKIAVPDYTATNFPPYTPIVSPAPYGTGVPRLPLLEFGDTNWDYCAVVMLGEPNPYIAGNEEGSAEHPMTVRLDGGKIYRLMADRNDQGTTWLGSRTWLMFATDFEWLRLHVLSPHGYPNPSGTYVMDLGDVRTNVVSLLDLRGRSRYLCRGWNLTGHEPASGVTNWFVMRATNDAALTWLWDTNYWLDTAFTGAGGVTPADQWVAAGVAVTAAASPAQYYHFAAWRGDVPPDRVESNPVSVTMDAPRTVTAAFDPDLATNDVPLWWLAAQGWTENFDEAAMDDQDLDGALTWEEWFADTVPTNAVSLLEVLGLTLDGAAPRIEWKGGVAARQYVERSGSLLPSGLWVPVFTNEPPTSVTNGWTDPAPSVPSGFYRIRVERYSR